MQNEWKRQQDAWRTTREPPTVGPFRHGGSLQPGTSSTIRSAGGRLGCVELYEVVPPPVVNGL